MIAAIVMQYEYKIVTLYNPSNKFVIYWQGTLSISLNGSSSPTLLIFPATHPT